VINIHHPINIEQPKQSPALIPFAWRDPARVGDSQRARLTVCRHSVAKRDYLEKGALLAVHT
ncbi:hypothetical protein A2U01_0108110, partial [Trifolium medium]|nr:hypothetical protein [Trifolium medium]